MDDQHTKGHHSSNSDNYRDSQALQHKHQARLVPNLDTPSDNFHYHEKI